MAVAEEAPRKWTPRAKEAIGMTDPTDMDAAVKRVQALSSEVVDKAKENGLAWLEGYERMLKNLLDLEEQAAKGTGVEWASTLASTHANFVRETSEVVFGVMREQFKK
jgi:hypothetical protein